MADTVVVAVVNEAETAAAAVVETGTVVVVVEVVEVSVVTSWLLESPAMMANHSDFKKKEKHKLQIIKIWGKIFGLLRDSFIYDCSHLTKQFSWGSIICSLLMLFGIRKSQRSMFVNGNVNVQNLKFHP